MSFQERLAIIVEANAGKAIAEFKKVGAAAKQAGGSAEGGAKGLARFGIAGQTATNLLKGGIAVAVAGAGAAIVKFAVDGVNAFVEVTGEIRKFQRVSGATAEDASKLVAAFHILGIDSDVAGASVFKLARAIEASGDKLAAVGVVVARTKDGNADLVATILNIGDAYKATEDPAKRANLVFTAFGRGGAPIIPLLGKTREQLEAIFAAAGRHGLIFSQEQLDKAKEFAAATRELGESWKGLQVEAGERLVPVLTDLAIAITKVIDATHQGIGKTFLDVLTHMPGVIQLVGGAAHLLAGDEGDVARAAAAAAQGIADQATAADALKKSIFGATDAQRSYEAAGRSVEAAHRSYNKALADYNKLLKATAVDAEKVADAQRSLASATRSVGHAQREQAKAQEEYNDAIADAAFLPADDAADKRRDATDNLADANDGLTSALEAQANAAADLAKAKAGDPDYQQKLADANQNVKDATQGIADAEYNLGKQSYLNVAAHDAEAIAIGGKADEVKRLRGELETMLALKPELFAFLGPILAALGGGNLSPVLAPGEAAAPAFGNFPAGSAFPTPTASGLLNSLSPVTTNNVTVNVAAPVADPVSLSKNIMWALP